MSNRSTRQSSALSRRQQDVKMYQGILKSGVFPVKVHGLELDKKEISKKLTIAETEVEILKSKGIS